MDISIIIWFVSKPFLDFLDSNSLLTVSKIQNTAHLLNCQFLVNTFTDFQSLWHHFIWKLRIAFKLKSNTQVIIGMIFISIFENDFYKVQKFGSTRNKSGLQYSLDLNELIVREVFVSKFHTSFVTLKIFDNKGSDMWHYNMLTQV